MPRIFDNIEKSLLPALREGLTVAYRADFCVGYFNLRGWRHLDEYIENWPGGAGRCCRLLVGMHRSPEEELQTAFSTRADDGIDNQRAIQFKRKLAEEFRRQLTFGAPTNQDEAALRRLARQIKERKVEIKLYLRHPLHAKLYLLYRQDSINPIVGYLGSSNLTFAGLSKQGELNVDVLDHDAGEKLQKWFEERWTDRWCLDISKELVEIIEESWAREKAIPPHHIYVKMAYHLSEEAREGLREFQLPRDFRDRLFQFQAAAVKIAAHHLNKRRGVLIGDVVGLGKTLMATALARIFEDNHGFSTLIICPKSLVAMWQSYVEQYGLRAKVVPISRVVKELPEIPARFRLVLIDESHNLRNRDGKRYRAIHEYIQQSGSRCILLSATPYNKTYLDLANQLRLFIREDQDLGIRPERLLRELGEVEFNQRFQCPTRSLAAFEKSLYADDWRELMRLYLVRRTRSFIQQHYAETDETDGRKYLLLEDGSRSYFPARIPRTVVFPIDERNPDDQYARLYADEVVAAINDLRLPRYGLGNYVSQAAHKAATPEVRRLLDNLGRAGQRLMGFCRTNLFKRLESSGQAFLLSLERHVLRNYVFLHALENDLPVPIGTQDAALLDARDDEDETALFDETEESDEQANLFETTTTAIEAERKIVNYQQRATEVYELYRTRFKNRFKWLAPSVFLKSLAKDLRAELDGLVAHLYELTGAEFASILTTFPLVAASVKAAALVAYRAFAPNHDDQAVATLLRDGESARVEFKLAARWNPHTNKKDDTLKDNIIQAVASFRNSREGGALFIGVNNQGQIVGLNADYQAANAQRPGRDSYELFLRDMLGKTLGGEHGDGYQITFHTLDGQDLCRTAAQPVYLGGELYVRMGNRKEKLTTQAALAYCRERWPQLS